MKILISQFRILWKSSSDTADLRALCLKIVPMQRNLLIRKVFVFIYFGKSDQKYFLSINFHKWSKNIHLANDYFSQYITFYDSAM